MAFRQMISRKQRRKTLKLFLVFKALITHNLIFFFVHLSPKITNNAKFDTIRPFYDSEINDAILNVKNHPMMKAMMVLLFQMWLMPFGRNNFQKNTFYRDFQCNFIYHTIQKF
jgi:hypothetical protein